jgi:hypothetical protein
MKRTLKYTDEPLGRLEIVDDFLPPPDQLVPKEDGITSVLAAVAKRKSTKDRSSPDDDQGSES